MMGFDDIIIGFIISYVAGSIPSLKDIFASKSKKSLENYVEDGYNQAITKWVEENPIRHKIATQRLSNIGQFCELVNSYDNNSISIIKELIPLWALELRKNEEYYQLLRTVEINNLSDKIDKLTKLIAQRDVDSLPQILRGLIQHKPVNGYIRRYCSSDVSGSNYLGYLLGTKERHTLAEYVTNIENSEDNKYILYSSAQYGKTTELMQLCWELQESGLYLPVSFEIRNNTTLKRTDLPSSSYYGDKEVVVIIDALDEVNGQKYEDLLEEIRGYAYDHPDIKMVLSCRSNYRREKQLDSFKELFLEELTGDDIREYVFSKLGKAQGRHILKIMADNQLYDFAKIPFFLNILIGASKREKPLPKTKADIYRLFVESSYYKEKTEKIVPTTKEHNLEESIKLLERAALGMSLLNTQSLTKEELQECLYNDSGNLEECLRFDLLRLEEGNQYSFKHNAFREWLAANYLSRAGLPKAIEFATHPNGRIKPEWYNIIMLWVSMYGKDKKEEISAILDWLKGCSLELVIYIDKDMLDERTRNEIFKGLLLEYKSLGIRMSNIMTQDYKNLLSFGCSDETVSFLADEIDNSKIGTAYYADLMCFCYFLDWDALERNNKDLTERLFVSLETKTKEILLLDGFNDLSLLYFDNEFFAREEYFGRIYEIVKDSEHYEAVRSMIRLIDLANNVDEYIDYILDKEKFVHNQTEGNTTHVVTRSCIYSTLDKVHSIKGVKKVLSHDFYDTRSYHQEDKDEYCKMMKSILGRACDYIKNGDLELAEILEGYFIRYYDNYHFHFDRDTHTQDLFQALRKCYIDAGLRPRGQKMFNEKVSFFFSHLGSDETKEVDLHKVFHMAALWMTEEDVKEDFSHFSSSTLTDSYKASWYHEIPYKEVAECASTLYKEIFPQPDFNKKRLDRNRKFFEDFANYSVFKQLVLEMASGLDEHMSRRENNKRLRELEEGYNMYASRFFIQFTKGSDEYDIQEIIRRIKDEEFYDAFFMNEIAEMLEHPGSELKITDEIKERCFSTARTIVLKIGKRESPAYFSEVAIKQMLKGLFTIPSDALLSLIDYGRVKISKKDEIAFYSIEYSLFDYIREHVAEEELTPVVLRKFKENINRAGYVLSYDFSKYILDNYIEEGYDLALTFALSDEYRSGNILDILIKSNIKVDGIRAGIPEMEVSNRLYCYSLLAKESQWKDWVKENLEAEYKSLDGYNLKRAIRLLISMGSVEALNHLQLHREDILEDDGFNFNYDNLNAVPTLCYFLDYVQKNRCDGPFVQNSILLSLERIATKSEDALIEVKSYLQKLIQKEENYKYLNRFLISFENKYYETYKGIKCIEDAMSMVDSVRDAGINSKRDTGKEESKEDDYIYISYSWEGESAHIVDFLCFVLEVEGVPYKLDKKDCHYTENIKEFMDAIRDGKTVVVVFSRPYMMSHNCMYELSGIMGNPSYKERILPVVVEDTIRDSQFYIQLVEFWKSKKDEVQENVRQLRAIDPEMAEPEEKVLSEINEVYSLLKEVKQYVDWANAANISTLCSERFKPLINIIRSKFTN